MKKLIYTIGVYFLFGFFSLVFAKQYVIEEYLKIVEEKNSEINYYRKICQSFKAKISRSYLLQNPSLEIEKMYIGKDQEESWYISQIFENPLRLSKYKKNSILEYDISRYRYESIKNKILAEVEMVYYDYIFILNKKKIFSEILDVLNTLLMILKNAPDSNSLDILKTELEYSMILKDLKEIEVQEKIYLTKLASYSGDYDVTFSSEVTQDIEVDYDKDRFFLDVGSNPDIQMSQKEVQLADVDLSISKISYIPNFMIGYRKRIRPSSYDIILGLDIPLFLNKNRSYIEENKLQKEAAMEGYKKNLLEKEYLLREIIFNLDNYYNLFHYYKEILLTKSEAEFNLSLSYYQKGEKSIEDLMKSFKRYLEIKIGYYNYLTNFYKERAKLKEIIGRKL